MKFHLKLKDLFHKIKIPNSNRILIQSIRNLRSNIYLKSQTSGRKIVIFFDAHFYLEVKENLQIHY